MGAEAREGATGEGAHRARPLLGAAAAVLAALLALLLLARTLRASDPWPAVAAFVEARAGRGDAVILLTDDRRAPPAFRRLAVLPPPHGGPDPDALLRELQGVERAWFVVPPDLPLPAPVFAREEGAWRLADGIRVLAYSAPAADTRRTRLADRLGSARVWRFPLGAEADGQPTPCPRVGVEHRCAGDDWRTIRERPARVAGREEQCIFAHPADGERLLVTFPDLRPGGRLRGWMAVADTGWVEGDPEPPVDVLVWWGRDPQATLRVADRPGRQVVDLPLPDASPRKARPLTLDVSAAHDGRRHLCFDLWWEAPPPPPPPRRPVTSPPPSPRPRPTIA